MMLARFTGIFRSKVNSDLCCCCVHCHKFVRIIRAVFWVYFLFNKCMHKNNCTSFYSHTHTQKHAHNYTHTIITIMHTHTHKACTKTCTYTHTQLCTHTHTKRAQKHAHIHTQLCTHTHTKRAQKHAHTQTQLLQWCKHTHTHTHAHRSTLSWVNKFVFNNARVLRQVQHCYQRHPVQLALATDMPWDFSNDKSIFHLRYHTYDRTFLTINQYKIWGTTHTSLKRIFWNKISITKILSFAYI